MGMYVNGGPTSVRISLQWADKLTPSELRIYVALKSLHATGRQTSYKNLAIASGMTGRMAARNALMKIIGKGLVQRIPPMTRGRGKSHEYIINDNVPM